MVTLLVVFCDTKGERSSSGLLEWDSINDAMEALAMMNHYQMKNPSKYSFCYNNIPVKVTMSFFPCLKSSCFLLLLFFC